MKKFFAFWQRSFVLFLLCLSSSAFGHHHLLLTDFQLGGIRVSPFHTPSSAFVSADWTPLYDMRSWAVRGQVGATMLANRNGGRYLTTNYQLYGMVDVTSLLWLEAGGGMQVFHGEGGAAPVAGVNILMRMGTLVDRLYMGYAYSFLRGNPANEYLSGVGFTF